MYKLLGREKRENKSWVRALGNSIQKDRVSLGEEVVFEQRLHGEKVPRYASWERV